MDGPLRRALRQEAQENDEMRELLEAVAAAWTGSSNERIDMRCAIREQSEAVYDVLGRISTWIEVNR
jgi:hypothetical protein